MAINAYVGIPGSGKSYEVVKSVILTAFLNGRRIVTNIEGVEESNFINYVDTLNEKRKEKDRIDHSSLGKIIKVTDEDCLKPNFFPYKGATEETIAKNGDLICIDEIWRIFDERKKIHANHRSFIAEHRHFVNEKGHTSDLVVINQSVQNIPRFIKDRIESTFKMTKHFSLGLSNRYRIDVYSGVRLFKTNKIYSIQSKYNPEIFKLYKSYDGNGSEKKIDNRINLLKNPIFWLKNLFSLLLFLGAVLYFYFQFSGGGNDIESPLENEENQVRPTTETRESTRKKTEDRRDKTTLETSQSKELLQDKGLSQKWRIIGYLKQKDNNLVILTDDKVMRYEYLSNFSNDGKLLIGHIDGYRVTFYSGQQIKREKSEEIRRWVD